MKQVSIVLAFACLVATLGGNDSALDERAIRAEAHRKLRFEYAQSPDYSPYAQGLVEIRKRSADMLEAEDFDGAILEANRGLLIDKLNIDLLVTQASAYRAKGDVQMADETRLKWMSLVDSIVEHGDGKTFATAFLVISVEEEYALLSIFGLERLNQRLIKHKRSEYDVLTVRSNESRNVFDLYFNVDIPKKWLSHRLDRKKK